MTKTDHTIELGRYSLGIPQGVTGRNMTQENSQTLTYGCNHCPQFTQDSEAHEQIFHPEVVQARNKKALKPKGIVGKVIAPILIAGVLLGGCGSNRNYTLENQKLQGWYEGNPVTLVFDEQDPRLRGDREPRFKFLYDGDPTRDKLKRFSQYDLVVTDTNSYSDIVSIKPSK
ncbi:hypothetical protein HY212_07545 [Candidatus Pacearchaeota archaeon]|nr:hypothetical protein [Candidatus Pacearchaeota archaeon]